MPHPTASTGTSGDFSLEDWTNNVKDALTQYERDHATHRASRDWLIRLWHDGLKTSMNLNSLHDEQQIIERVIDSMNLFLTRSKL